MTDDTPFQDKVRRAADGAMLTFVARWAMAITLPIGGFIGVAVWNKLDKASESTARLEERVSTLIEREIPNLNLNYNGRLNAQADRITEHDRRLGKLEDWRNSRSGP